MIGTRTTGTLPGIVISTVAHVGLRVTIDGKPGRLAILNEAGEIVAEGEQVADEAEAVSVNGYRAFLQCEGHLQTRSAEIQPTEPRRPKPRRKPRDAGGA